MLLVVGLTGDGQLPDGPGPSAQDLDAATSDIMQPAAEQLVVAVTDTSSVNQPSCSKTPDERSSSG